VIINETRLQAQVLGVRAGDNKWNANSGTGVRC